jgi:hypothetical protein
MEVPDPVLTITKAEGASRQVEEAIRALQRGDFDIALTLAGAAEGMLERPGLHLWAFMLNSPKVADFDKKDLIGALNADLYWLKHPTPNAGESLTLTKAEPAFMIARAASKLEKWSPLMDEFKAWLVENLDEICSWEATPGGLSALPLPLPLDQQCHFQSDRERARIPVRNPSDIRSKGTRTGK